MVWLSVYNFVVSIIHISHGQHPHPPPPFCNPEVSAIPAIYLLNKSAQHLWAIPGHTFSPGPHHPMRTQCTVHITTQTSLFSLAWEHMNEHIYSCSTVYMP